MLKRIIRWFASAFKDQDVIIHEQYVEVFKLTRRHYEVIEKTVGYIGLNSNTTPIEAAYLLGIQRVLKELRDNHSVEKL